jgi:4'-phosphopantetheinyl transferase
MRRIVAAYQGCAPRDALLDTPYGRPPRAAGGLKMSLAHCDELALVAVARTAVGIDVEPLSTADDEDLDDLAELILTARELERFRAEPDSERPRSWLRSWTRKEAVLKARGEGLGDRLMSEINVADERVGALTLGDLEPADGHLGAIAIAHGNPRVAWRELNR